MRIEVLRNGILMSNNHSSVEEAEKSIQKFVSQDWFLFANSKFEIVCDGVVVKKKTVGEAGKIEKEMENE